MAKQDTVRSKLQTKVFTPYGKTVTLIKYLSPTYNERGELESGYTQSTSSITVVPYNILDSSRQQERVGDANTGSLQMAIPYTVSVSLKDEILMEGDYWVINEIEKNYLPDNVVTIVSVNKRIA